MLLATGWFLLTGKRRSLAVACHRANPERTQVVTLRGDACLVNGTPDSMIIRAMRAVATGGQADTERMGG